MADEYQRGSDDDWVKHQNEEMSRMLKQRERQLGRLRLICILLFLALGWVLFRYRQQLPLESLWRF